MKFLFSILVISVCIACGKGVNEEKKDGSKGGKYGPLTANTCIVSSPDGELPDGGEMERVNLQASTIKHQKETLYQIGKWPSNYVLHREGEYQSPTKPQLLQKAKTWKWVMGPARPEYNNFQDIALWKEVMYTNKEVYAVDFQEIDVDAWEYFDEDTNILIECNVPN